MAFSLRVGPAAARLSSIHSTIRALAFSLRMVEYRGVSVGVMSVMQMFAMGRYAMTAFADYP